MTNVIHIRQTTKGWQSDPNFVYIGRPGRGLKSEWGNPFLLLPGATEEERDECLRKYERYVRDKMKDPEFRKKLVTLKGKTLVCFCKPKRCHGDILAQMAELADAPA